ncbi:RNA polymerase sigma factor region1.1 domain-containing protein [Azospirillum agricola]|uniref:RNA polymerase sigma factor region1.1 domain-containing protein n=1 Tax=Azospirillum agricola TaxID=1720247 RepID=UPI000A0F3779|nr:RNA polymerase sigma factor region1.1 domain-containing protein [Azospirillum agricola]SMH53091.1 Sigma-70 factor, region 1.1 [Azospirillum lipoferum]
MATTQPVSDATIQSLIEQGRRSGNRLGAEALGAALPIETMTPEEIAAAVERIEAAGVEVELDDSRLMRSRGAASGDYRRGDGVVGIASPAAPAVSAPGAVPSRHGWADDIAAGAPNGVHGHGASPTWTRDGVEMLPLASLAGVAIVLLIALGGH